MVRKTVPMTFNSHVCWFVEDSQTDSMIYGIRFELLHKKVCFVCTLFEHI